MYSYHIYFFFVFFQRTTSPSAERRCAYSPATERGRTTTQHRQERRDRDHGRATENKENVAVQEKDVEIFALPPPRTPVSSKKNARPNKNVLTTPNQNVNGTKTTPKGKRSFSATQVQTTQSSSFHHAVYLYTIIVFCSKQGLEVQSLLDYLH